MVTGLGSKALQRQILVVAKLQQLLGQGHCAVSIGADASAKLSEGGSQPPPPRVAGLPRSRARSCAFGYKCVSLLKDLHALVGKQIRLHVGDRELLASRDVLAGKNLLAEHPLIPKLLTIRPAGVVDPADRQAKHPIQGWAGAANAVRVEDALDRLFAVCGVAQVQDLGLDVLRQRVKLPLQGVWPTAVGLESDRRPLFKNKLSTSNVSSGDGAQTLAFNGNDLQRRRRGCPRGCRPRPGARCKKDASPQC
mmetsp:Transcript_615/g.1564  ORF Transcript_615/g.1564 Transcript_615/m.1564 type:complete len:251 (+) Transcript_615:285-1037(+)